MASKDILLEHYHIGYYHAMLTPLTIVLFCLSMELEWVSVQRA